MPCAEMTLSLSRYLRFSRSRLGSRPRRANRFASGTMTQPNHQRQMGHNQASFSTGLLTIHEPAHAATKRSLTTQIVRRGIVGAFNTVVDRATLNRLILMTHAGQRGAM